MPDPIIVPLSRPIVVIDQHFAELKVREPTGLDLMRAGDPAERFTFLARIGAACAELPIEAVEKMPASDVLALTGAVSGFLEASPPTGSSASTSKSPAGGGTPSSSS